MSQWRLDIPAGDDRTRPRAAVCVRGFHGVGKMKSKCAHRRGRPGDCHAPGHPVVPARHDHPFQLKRWLLANSIISGICALAWLILRSGTKPSRFAYPCQQAALSTATLAFGVPAVAAILGARRRLVAALNVRTGLAMILLGLIGGVGMWVYSGSTDAYSGPVLSAGAEYRASIFHVSECPQSPIGDRFVGLDNLLTLMGREGTKLYQSATESLLSGPGGIIAADDVVVVKINYQWAERGGTNTDLLRGLLSRLLEHPDGFSGEIVICENTQFAGSADFDRAANNAEDRSLSPRDVVSAFQQAGHPVSLHDWTAHRSVGVGEYADGDMADGYVVYAYDTQLAGRISYPKFRTEAGTYVSLRDGIWDTDTSTYDRERLKVINVPVLKAHMYKYGATACVKNNMGVLTTALSTNAHNATANGMMGALLAEIRPANLNILDCIWTSAGPVDGPGTLYTNSTRRDELLGGVDPVAIDMWAVKNILIPTFLANGFTPPWPAPSADPDDPSSAFRGYLDHATSYLVAAGYSVTHDPAQFDVYSWNGAGDTDGDSDVDLFDHGALVACLDGPDVSVGPGCHDFDSDDDGDLQDFALLQRFFSGPVN